LVIAVFDTSQVKLANDLTTCDLCAVLNHYKWVYLQDTCFCSYYICWGGYEFGLNYIVWWGLHKKEFKRFSWTLWDYGLQSWENTV